MLRAALGWGFGCLLTHALPELPGAVWLVPASLTALALLGTRAAPCVLASLAACAWTVNAAQGRLLERIDTALIGRDIELRGWLDGFPQVSNEQVSFSLRVAPDARRAGLPPRLRLVWYRPASKLQAADAVELVVRLRRPRGLANPGGSDAARWALVERFGGTGYVRSMRPIELPVSLERWWLGVRAELARRLESSSLSAQANALLAALALGERADFTDAHWSYLSRTGTSHLVAISGLHIGLVAGLLFVLARLCVLRLPPLLARCDLELASLCAFAGAALYAALAGFTLPTQRALMMLLVGLFVVLSRRRCRPFDALGIALVFVLIWDPFGPLRASFWLSFGAVVLIGLAGSVRSPKAAGPRALLGLRRLAEVQCAVTIGLTPVIAVFFAQLGLIAPVVNLLAVPVFSFVLVPAVLCCVLLAAVNAQGLVDCLLPWVGRLADATWAALEWAAAPDWASIVFAPPAPWAVLLAGIGAMVLLPGACPWRGRWASVALLGALAQGYGMRLAPGDVRSTILDVGHGLAVLVQTAHHALLFDVGPRYPSGFDAGRAAVLPATAALGIRHVDRVIVSHADADHSGGMAAVRERFPNADWLVGPDVDLPGSRFCAAGQHWRWDQVDFAILHPLPERPGLGNSSSCVLRIEAQGHSLLLTGDIESAAEGALLARGDVHPTSVVIMPHHGSATSSTPNFVARLSPEFAIASAGYANRWNFPRPEVRERWHRVGAQVWVTGDTGAVTVYFAPEAPPQLSSERARRKRYWSTD